jgi:hypothetical protein
MAKRHLKLVTPATVLRTVTPKRPPNSDLRRREHLTEAEVERLLKAAGRNRWGHRDATMIRSLLVNRLSASWPRSAPAVQRRRSELKYRTLGRWRWRWCSAAPRRDVRRRRRDRRLWQRRLPRSLDPASPDTVLLTADRTNVAARARLLFLRMRNHAESRNDDSDECQAYYRHLSPPLRHHMR